MNLAQADQTVTPGEGARSARDPADGIWMCRTERAAGNESPAGPLDQPLTVGEKFVLTCEGATVELDPSKLSLQLPTEEKYSLRLLRIQSLNENKGVFTATSYRVGEGPLKGVVLGDGVKSVELQGIELQLRSSIDPSTNPEGKPFAPPDPLAFLWPIWLWVALGGLVLAVGLVCFMIFRRRGQRQALLAELARHGTALSPYHQFNKDLRHLAREFPVRKPEDWTPKVASQYMEELNRHFRWYLSREFTVPAFQWSDSLILKEVRKRSGQMARASRRGLLKDLRLTLQELSKGMSATEKLSVLDGQQLVDLCRKVADDLERELGASGPGRDRARGALGRRQ